MAYTDITNQLLNNQYALVDGVAYVTKSNAYSSSYGFATSAYGGTNYFASQNLNVHNSAASIRLNISPVDSVKGVNVLISYIIDSERSYDIGYFGKSGATLPTGSTLTTGYTDVYAHTYNQNGYSVRTVEYFLPSSTNIDIIYKKDGSQNTGWDRLLFGIAVELGSGTGGGGTDPSTTYYWMLGTRILPVGTRKAGDGTYTLPSTALTSFTAHLEACAGGFPGADMTVLTSGNYRILWASGSSTSNIWGADAGGGSSPYTSDLPYTLGGVFGHSDLGTHIFSSKIYTGTTAQLYNPASVFASFNNTATFEQCRYYVLVQSDKNALTKAYFDVDFDSPFNQTWKTGKSGYVRLISSATNSSVSITVSRTGSGSKSGTLTRPNDTPLVLSPTSNSDKICTVADLAEFDSSAAAAISTNNKLCVKYNSSIHDTGYSGTNKLMHIHEFLYFTGTPEYFKDDSQDSGGSGGSGYEVNGEPLTISWFNNSPTTVQLNTLSIFGGSVDDGTQLYRITSARNLAGDSLGSFVCGIMNEGYADGVTALTAVVSVNYNVDMSLTLSTQSNGDYYFYFPVGGNSVTLPLQNNITITGGTLTISNVIS